MVDSEKLAEVVGVQIPPGPLLNIVQLRYWIEFDFELLSDKKPSNGNRSFYFTLQCDVSTSQALQEYYEISLLQFTSSIF